MAFQLIFSPLRPEAEPSNLQPTPTTNYFFIAYRADLSVLCVADEGKRPKHTMEEIHAGCLD